MNTPSLHPRFWKVGSDPELLFIKNVDYDPMVVPANQVFNTDRAAGLRTFIGVDGHPATGELRPPPTRNVWRHIYDIAFALVELNAFLKRGDKHNDVGIRATPFIQNEPLGGHIHLSFFVEDPLAKHAALCNRIYTTDLLIADENRNTRDPSKESTLMLRDYVRSCTNGLTIHPVLFSHVLGKLLMPFERWVQPWQRRTNRNGRYGNNTDVVRWVTTTMPTIVPSAYKNMAYFHYEYRMPSTWLQHPLVAYCYLGLAKLCILNFEEIATMDSQGPDEASSQNKMWEALFIKRFSGIIGKLRFSKDLRGLESAIATVAKNRNKWMDPNANIQSDAWRELVPEGT